MGFRSQQAPTPTSPVAEHFLDQTRIIYQDVRRNAMQTYIKHKSFYNKNINASKLKRAGYVYVLKPKADHQGSKIRFPESRWIGR